jgi:esterase/lipase superfamily enzyme
MALDYNPSRPLELQFDIGGDAVATCFVRAADGERIAESAEPTVAVPGRPGVKNLMAPLPEALQIDVAVEGRTDTNYLLITELRQGRRLPRFETASGHVAKGAVKNLSLIATATPRFMTAQPDYELPGAEVSPFPWLKRLPHPEPVPPPEPSEQRADYIVWFGTNRKPTVWQDSIIDFGPDRDNQLHVGQCRVTIPKSHEIGSVGSSWLKRVLQWTDDRLAVAAIHVLEQELYWAEIAQYLETVSTDDRHGVVYIHGYSNTFRSAAIRAAQLGFDLKISGAMAFYSWPSQGSLGGYMADEASIEASEGFVADYLTSFATRSRATKVHVIAHSMGNRALLRAVDRIASKASSESGTPFNQLIVAAPDVDRQVFEQLSLAYGQLAERTTMYVCSKDKAVGASRWLHSYDRAGLTPPVVVVPGVDTVSVSDLDLTLLGHGYVQEAKELLADMYELIRNGTPPSKRFRLNPMTSPSGVYWNIGR